MAKRKTKYDPKDTSYMKYEVLSRTIVKHTTYDEHIVDIRKTCTGNPVEQFITVQNVRYNVPHKIDEEIKVAPTVKKTVKKKSLAQKVKEAVTPKRARNKKGHYIKDDPSTPENEAWEGGKAPPKKKTTTRKKRTKS
tara:strand:+ start:22 stop:432 length:411 start_codon:yes stop_codon:yes gene_type:complete